MPARKGRKRYAVVATGGTFDTIHRGHRALLDAAFDASEKVIIGLTSDAMLAGKGEVGRGANKKKGHAVHSYAERLAGLQEYIRRSHPGSAYMISGLDDDFGPAVLTGEVEALVASEETACKADKLNGMRLSRGLGPVETVVVGMVAAHDGGRISSSRIRNGEIDADGNAA